MSSSDSSYNRPILPAPTRSEPQMHISHTLLLRPSRIGVSVACESCRRRKTRCSGQRPRCEKCDTNGTACTYALPLKDHELRQQIRTLKTQQEVNGKLIELLRSRNAGEASLILNLLRQNTSVQGILRQIELGDMLCNLSHQADHGCS
ncbi:hypothetical protein FPOA_02035 [Fusarium poae]|jgi:hypothetical protein|uniref:Zn(2)-C6 fungal-type domain-containing protein n=1 Tax=Fusarium poae TaxID=36050 RepID=A0A1B8B5U4_FUSPO|nr:hypothetical protein FPOA_02035 [Fusarium poae]